MGALDVRRHHPHDRERVLAHDHPAPDHVARAAVPALPQTVGDHEHVLGADDVVRATERAAQNRLDTEDAEEVAGDGRAGDVARDSVLDRGERRRVVVVADAGDALEDPALFADHVDVVCPERKVREALRGKRLPRDEKPALLANRQRAQQHSFNEREHGRGAGNPHCQREDRHAGEAPHPQQPPPGEPQIIPPLIEDHHRSLNGRRGRGALRLRASNRDGDYPLGE